MDNEQIPVNPIDREYRKKRVEELGSTLAQIRARVKANRGSGPKKDEEIQQSGSSKPPEDTERTALTKKILEEDRARFTKLQQNRVKMKEAMDQMLIEREEQKKVEKQLQEAIAKVTAPTPELPPLIKQRIIDLETTVENLKERLSEKDKVLSSKTQALTVLHNQLMQRSQEQVEKAMAFTQEISTIKDDFGKREELLKKEIIRLKEREEELEWRLSDKEAYTNEIESVQAELSEVRKELNETLNKNEESSKQLESINKINLKLKAQLKALKIERDKLKQAQESVEDINSLKNRIALLEEEKESFEESQEKIKSLQKELELFREDVKNLQEEKVSLQERLDDATKRVEEQENLIESLRLSLKEMEEQKISAEMRSIEIEEKMEGLQNDTSGQIEQLMNEIHSLKSEVSERSSTIDSLTHQLNLKDQEISDIKGNNFPAEMESDSRLREIELYNSELMEKVRELQLKAEGHEKAAIQLNETLSERNETINCLRIKNDELKTTVIDLNNNKTLLENEIQRLKANEGSAPTDSKEDPNLTQKFKKLAANYKMKVKLCQELEEKLKIVNVNLDEKNNLISELSSQKEDLKLQLDELIQKQVTLTSELDDVKIKNGELLKLVSELAPKLEAMEAERSTALIKADRMNRAFEELKEWKEGDSKLLKEHVTSVNSMASNVSLLEQELRKLQSIVNEKNSVIGELEMERKKLVEDMRNSELELERLRGLYQQESVKNQNVLTNLQGLESEMLVSREEMNQIAEQLEAVTKNYNMCLGNLQERENYIEALEQDIVGMKSKMYNLEAGIGDRHRILEERGNQLSARLEEAEILTQTFDKYQTEMDNKFKMMEDNEKAMKFNLSKLQNEIENLNKLNTELKLKNETSESKISEMVAEISTLNDIKSSYNSTLDRIEILNNELKEVMCDFEAKNQEILKLGEERADLFNKLTDLEDAYSDLKAQLEETEDTCSKLQNELDVKTHKLNAALQDVSNLQDKINDFNKKSFEEEKVLNKHQIENKTVEAIQVFSWDQHSHGDAALPIFKPEESSFKELEECKMMLYNAQKENENLQLHLNEKDKHIKELRECLAGIKLQYDELQKKAESQNNIVFPDSIPTFSWNPQNQVSDIFGGTNQLQEQLNKSMKDLEHANLELETIKASMEVIINEKEKEISQFRNELKILKEEKAKLEKSLEEQNGHLNHGETQFGMFSWNNDDKSNFRDEEDGLKFELKEKTRYLEAAQQEIANLQAALSSMLSEKESEVSAMKEEIRRLLSQKEDLEKMLRANQTELSEVKQDDIRMFSWGQQNPEVGKDEEDGWGWIGAEAHLEQDHKHSEAIQIQTLTQKVRELEEEKVSLNEKLNASKIKCIKLLKKLKEMEAIQEQSRNERNIGFSDLDFALQEELRSQLDQLENKNKELTTELNNIKLERENLNKKVDVLVSANDQLIEMKERQDIEVQMWQKRSMELKNEVQGLQWSLEELKSEVPSLNKGGDDLSDKLNALAQENEELQRIICNLKDGRPLGSPDITSELNALKDELKRLKEVRAKEKETFENELKKANEELDAMEQQYDTLSKENQSMKEEAIIANNLKQDICSLNEHIEVLTAQNKLLEQEISELKARNSDNMNNNLELLRSENTSLKNELLKLSSAKEELLSIEEKLQRLRIEKEELQRQLDSSESMKAEVSTLFDKIQQLGFENADLKEKLAHSSSNSDIMKEKENSEKLKQQINNLTDQLDMVKQEFGQLTNVNKQLQQEMFSLKNTFESDMKKVILNAENDIKNLENSLLSAQSEIKELDSFVDEVINKCNLTIFANNRSEKLRNLSTSIHSILTSISKSKNENLTDNYHESAQSSVSLLGSTPPVFKGFTALSNDPFDSLHVSHENKEVDKLISEIAELKTVIKKYEHDFSNLNAEKMSYENVIAELKHEIASMNEHVAKLNLLHSKQVDDMRLKLENADKEIVRCREEANNLRRELNNLLENHSQEIEELKRSEDRSREKVSEIEENFQNTLLNKDQESRSLKQILSEKEQLLANAINERNALQNQFDSKSQQFFNLEKRLQDLVQENEELQSELNNSRRDENTVIEKQKEEIQELMAKLEYMSQSQSLQSTSNQNEELLKQQIKDLTDQLSLFQASNTELHSKISAQTEEILSLRQTIADIDNNRHYLEHLLTEKSNELELIKNQVQTQSTILSNEEASEKLTTLIREKDLEIARVSKVLHDTQERLVKVQESKSIDKILSLETKLNQALYTLHVRDVRIDELTQEIMQLLEERDTLQLRLSECLRENEILRKGTAASSSTSSPEFKNKLGELHQGYKRDPVVQLEMESRHNDQMDLYAEKEEPPADYGIFNWFFSSPQQAQQQ